MINLIKEDNKDIKYWLLISIILVYLMIILGGYTRLSHSGLSIVEWNPISGVIPPLDHNSWQNEFLKYQASPEFIKLNNHINLDDFKKIFWIEFLHRILGRIIGLFYIVPFLFFVLKKKFSLKDLRYYGLISGLIGFQGLIGWLMVKTGLNDQPNVSQYALALHLFIASIIISLLTLKFTQLSMPNINNKISKYGCFCYIILLLQITSGAFVAGLHAGLIYNTYPLMGNEFIPFGLFIIKPWYLNFFENATCVQFIHRNFAIFTVLNLLAYCYKVFKLDAAPKISSKKTILSLVTLIFLQFILGILTLILQVPLILALIHQAVAFLLLINLVITLKKY